MSTDENKENNAQIFITPPTSNHSTVHSIKEISNLACNQKSKDDNSDVERNRKTSKFWFLKPGNLLTSSSSAAHGGDYNPYHTIAATPSNTFKTSPSTARLNNYATNTDSKTLPKKKRKKTVTTTPYFGEVPVLPVQENQRKTRIRTTSLCDPKQEAHNYDLVNKTFMIKASDVKELEIDASKSSPKVKRPLEIPSNFETSEAVFRLQLLFSTTHTLQSTHSNNSSIASEEVPAGVAYAESCSAFGAANPANSRPTSRHQSPLAMANLIKPISKNSSHSTLVQSKSTPYIGDFRDTKQTHQQQAFSNSPAPLCENLPTLRKVKRKAIISGSYQKQASPSPQRQESSRAVALIESHMTKSKSASSFSQYTKLSPINDDKCVVSNEIIEGVIPEHDIDRSDNKKKTATFYVNVPDENAVTFLEDSKEDFKITAVRNTSDVLSGKTKGNENIISNSYSDPQLMLDPKLSNLYENIKWMYANLLYNSKLYLKHCDVLNKVVPYPETYISDNIESLEETMVEENECEGRFEGQRRSYPDKLQVECSFLGSIHFTCAFCGECYNIDSQCTGCRKPSLYCSVCRMPVIGLASSCLRCNHGGHTVHIQQWFEKRFK